MVNKDDYKSLRPRPKGPEAKARGYEAEAKILQALTSLL